MATQPDYVKNQRSFVATIGTNSGGVVTGGTLTVQSPFTCEVDIVRGSFNSMNHMTLRLYNLSEATRNSIFWDETNYLDRPTVEFRAGYGPINRTVYPWKINPANLSVCFRGTITSCYSVREGVNFITTIQAFDGGDAYINASIAAEFTSGTPVKSVIDSVLRTLAPYGIGIGAVGNTYTNVLPRGNSLTGNSAEILTDLTGGGFKIDNGKVYCLADNECVPGVFGVINSESGLLGTPVREGSFLSFDMIFEPRLLMFQQVKLDSITGGNFNGLYKVVSLRHHGMISESVCGSMLTTVGLFYGTFLTTVVGK